MGRSESPGLEGGSESQIMVYVKIHVATEISQDFREVVAICDEELLGRKFQEGDVVLHLNEEFFKGFLATLDEAMHHARNASIIVLAGEASVDRAVKEGLVHPDAILRVCGVPYAQVVRL
ncbi:MAG: DUF424 domain-containing protein [Desulfurococcaceae archaeon TW002]